MASPFLSKPMRHSQGSSWPGSGIALLILALCVHAQAAAAAPENGFITCAAITGSNLMLILAASGGIAIAAGLFGIINREKARRLAAILARNSARLDVLSTAERDFRALASLEPKALVVWDDGEPRLAFHSFQPVHGVPSKLPHLLRFGSWLHLEDAAKIAENVSGLQDRGEAFAANASTLDGNVLEIAGAPFGTGTVLRISLFSPPNKELARLIAENKRLKQSTEDREKLLDS